MDELQKEDGKYDYVCCTVAPFNIPSLKDKFAQGMEIAALKEKYGGSMRYVFVKELRKDIERDWSDVKSVPMSDFDGQKSCLLKAIEAIRWKNTMKHILFNLQNNDIHFIL